MRKDFLVEPVQVLEARKAGASGVLLITTMLDDAKLRAMLDCAWDHGMFVLLETFDEEDLQRRIVAGAPSTRIGSSGQLLVGVNTRNLRTLEVDADRLAELAPRCPRQAVSPKVACTQRGMRPSRGVGLLDLALVGSALMRSDDPAALVAEMRAAGSAGCSMSTFVKICGLRDAADVAAAVDAGADAVGFVFAESVRQVTTGAGERAISRSVQLRSKGCRNAAPDERRVAGGHRRIRARCCADGRRGLRDARDSGTDRVLAGASRGP